MPWSPQADTRMGITPLSSRIFAALLAMVLLTASFVAVADEASWVRFLDAGTAAYNRRDPGEATRQFEFALKEAESFGESDSRLTTSLAWLAEMYRLQRRFDDAERLIRRTIALDEKYRGPDHTDLAMSLESLALLFHTQNRQREMEPVLKRALGIYERARGSSHPRVASALNNLASLYRSLGRVDEAEPLVSRALAIREKALGPDHPDTVLSRNYLAQLHRDLARSGAAPRRQAPVAEAAAEKPAPVQAAPAPLPPAPVPAPVARAQPVEAVAPPRQVPLPPAAATPPVAASPAPVPTPAPASAPAPAVAVAPMIAKPMPPAKPAAPAQTVASPKPVPPAPIVRTEPAPAAKPAAQAAVAPAAVAPLALAAPVAPPPAAAKPPPTRAPMVAPQAAVQPRPVEPQPQRAPYRSSLSLQMVSLGASAARNSGTAAAQAFELMQMAREREDDSAVARIVARFGRDDQALAKLVGQREDLLDRWHGLDKALLAAAGNAGPLRAELAGVDQRLAQQDALIGQQIPGYRNYLSPQPVSLRAAQEMLAGDEALLSYLVDESASYLMVVRRDRFMFLNLNIGRQELSSIIRRLRQELDHPTGDDVARNVFRAFPVAQANQLYRRILGVAEPALQGATHLLIVGDDTLNGLPFAALATAPLEAPLKAFEDHAKVAWLGRRYALTVLPSEGTLRALRRTAAAPPVSRPFIGYGDPLLAGEERGSRDAGSRSRSGSRAYSRDSLANVNQVWNFAPLPESRYALYAMADLLKADQDAVHLQAEATEAIVKRQDLSDYRVIAFATHGFMADDFRGLAESSLVFTPPTQASDRDDGLLTASEVAQFKLGADLVILTATSTAASDGTPDSQGVTALARAFMHAGTRAVLATHWSVPSDATLKLVTRTLRERNRGIGNAEALRRAMLPLMNGEDRLAFAHPSYWAPFMVIGDDDPRTTAGAARAGGAPAASPAREQQGADQPRGGESEGSGLGKLLQGIFGGK